MLHLLQMNLRLVFRKSYLLSALVFTAFCAAGTAISARFLGDRLPGLDFGNYSEHFCIFLSEGFLLLFFAYCAGLMVTEDYSTGYLRNIIHIDSGRRSLILTKFFAIVLFIIAVTICFTLFLWLFVLVFLPGFEWGDPGRFFLSLSLQSLLAITLSSIVVMIGSFFRKSFWTLILSTFLCTGTLESVLNLINRLQESVWSKVHFDFTRLGLYELVSGRPELSDNPGYLIALCAVYTAFCLSISVYFIRNRDVV